MVSRPPSGIASRALMHRLSSAFSSCDGSISVGHRPPAPTTSTVDLRPDGAADQLLHARDQAVDVGRLGIERLAAREGEQALGQRGGALAPRPAPRRYSGRARRGGPGASALCSSSRLPDDAGQQIVEVVRDAAGQLADRLHLLRLAQRLLGVAQRSAAPAPR